MDQSQRNAGKVAGLAYLLSFAAVVTAQFRIQDRLIVNRSNAETVRNILEHERFFRIGVACDLFYSFGTVVLLVALYVILRPVNRGLALFAALGRLVYALMWVLMTVNLLDRAATDASSERSTVAGDKWIAGIGCLLPSYAFRSVLRWTVVLWYGVSRLRLSMV